MLIRSLTEKLHERDFGGKAAGLSRMLSLGINVPAGYAVAKSAHQLYIRHGKFPPKLARELPGALSHFSGSRLIVRSSAIGEDSDTFSYAGQLDSFVVENSVGPVTEGILKCWASLGNDRAGAYQAISGTDLLNMGVVIQQFVEAEYAGVLFTRSPDSQDLTYTEYVQGGSEPLVSGKVTPHSFYTNPESEMVPEKVLPFDHKILINKSLYLKEQFGKHLDIEWLYSGGSFYFVQARPITIRSDSKCCWTNTNLNENYPGPVSPLLYSIARDAYYHYFKNLARLLRMREEPMRSLEYDFSNSVGIFGNRIYYNMTSIHNIIAASPYQAYFQDAFNNFVGYRVSDASTKGFGDKPSLLRLAARLVYLNLSLSSHVRSIEAKVTAFSGRAGEAKDLKALAGCFYEFLDLRFNQWYHAGLADLFSMVHYKLLGSFTRCIYGDGHTGVQNTLIQAIPGLISSQPLIASWKIIRKIEGIPGGAEFFLKADPAQLLLEIRSLHGWEEVVALIDKYLAEWGFRCSGELMLTYDNYIVSPEKYMALLQSYMQSGHSDPESVVNSMDNERKRLLADATGKIFRKRHLLFPLAIVEAGLMNLLARLCRQAIMCRERVRYKQAQMYYHFRNTVFRIGGIFAGQGLLDMEGDVIYLNYKEIGSLLSSSDMFAGEYRELVKARREAFERESLQRFPASFETKFGERPSAADPAELIIPGGRIFLGLAASGGKKQAKVKVLTSVLETGKLLKGEILVTEQTDPGWAMAFPIIGGLIVERGGALSHGAIVAREFGIPAVVGVERITEILHDGDEVLLDGNHGKIHLI